MGVGWCKLNIGRVYCFQSEITNTMGLQPPTTGARMIIANITHDGGAKYF